MRKRNTIAKTWEEITMEDQMDILFSENQNKLVDFSGDSPFNLDHAALLSSLDADTGETHELLVLKDTEGVMWATISPTFIDSFVQISDFLAAHQCRLKAFTIEQSESKKGRKFMVCRMDSYEKRADK